jgi:hypothetical protein
MISCTTLRLAAVRISFAGSFESFTHRKQQGLRERTDDAARLAVIWSFLSAEKYCNSKAKRACRVSFKNRGHDRVPLQITAPTELHRCVNSKMLRRSPLT